MTTHENTAVRRSRKKRFPRALIIAGGIILVLLIAAVGFSVYVNNSQKSYPNTYVGDIDVSGKTTDEIRTLLDEESTRLYDSVSFRVTVGSMTKTVLASDLMVAIDSAKAADQAIAYGRDGNFLTRPVHYLSALFGRETITTPVVLDDELLTHLADEFSAVNVAPVDASYKVENNELILSPPTDGITLNKETFKQTIREKFESFSYDDVTIEPEVVKAAPLDMDAVYQEVHKEVSDAKLEEVDGKNKVTPHVVGVDFDLAAAKETLASTPDQEVRIALTLTQPKVTTQMVQATLFQDTLSQQTTYYSPRKANRVSNVKLAAKNINGTILNPGEVFSFNKTVGPRTAARGFKEAQIFASGEIVDGLGGGICQVSSTLYMASMKADLKTVSRRNHSFYVDYAPKGQDATVVYGSIDFQFENDSPYPIKILAYAEDSFVRITIKGTKTEQKSVKIKTTTLSTTPYQTKTIVDNSLAPGQRVVQQKGQEGIVMEAYRYVYDANGNLLSKSFENRTKYVPLTEIVHVGPSSTASANTAPTAPASGSSTPNNKPEQNASAQEGTSSGDASTSDKPDASASGNDASTPPSAGTGDTDTKEEEESPDKEESTGDKPPAETSPTDGTGASGNQEEQPEA